MPLKFRLGTKRILSVSFNNNAALVVTDGIAVQFTPPSVEYCHIPFVLSRVVTAMPRGVLSLSLDVDPVTMSENKVPVLLAERISSGIAVIPVRLKSTGFVGASLTGVTLILIVFVSVNGPPVPVFP